MIRSYRDLTDEVSYFLNKNQNYVKNIDVERLSVRTIIITAYRDREKRDQVIRVRGNRSFGETFGDFEKAFLEYKQKLGGQRES